MPQAALHHHQPHVVALVGPTASGKTGLALELARHFDLEIISLDSALVYRGMDIGTAKPSLMERAQVPHHLIDIIDPAQTYSAAEFAKDARRLIADIHQRGKRTLLVGGTMLYLKALMDPLDDMPPANAQCRLDLEQEAQAHGWPALHAQLALVDPMVAARLSPNDSQRIGRALEVFRTTGQPMSSFHGRRTALESAPDPIRTMPIIALEPTDRSWLHQRIAQRFEAMLNQGFLDEMQHLRQRGDLQPDLPSMRCVGYRQAWGVLDAIAPQSVPSVQQMASILDLGIIATRQLAKRQLTWLRSMPQRTVLACDHPDVTIALLHAYKAVNFIKA